MSRHETPPQETNDPYEPRRYPAWEQRPAAAARIRRSAAPWQRSAAARGLLKFILWMSLPMLCCATLVAPRYFVSPACAGAMFPLLMLMSAFLCAMAWDGPLRREPRGMLLRYFAAPACILGAVFFCWGQGLPVLLHRFDYHGDGISAHVQYSGVEHGRRCTVLPVQELDDYWFGEVCVQAGWGSIGRGDGTIVLNGSRSWFGIDVTSYRFNGGNWPNGGEPVGR